MLDKYILKLYKYYCKVMGIKFNPLTYIYHKEEFFKWLEEYKIITQEFKEYLISLGYYNYYPTAEINKGKYDSIADDKLVVYSPYAKTLNIEPTTFAVVGITPVVCRKNKPEVPKERIYLINNPLQEEIDNWPSITKRSDMDISIGIYGLRTDKNYVDNIVLLNEIKRQLSSDYILEQETNKDRYYLTLNNKKNTNVLRFQNR